MPVVYLGVLKGDRIEWQGRSRPPAGPVRVVVAPPEPPADEQWLGAVAHLEAIAQRGDLDAAEWERTREEVEGEDDDPRG
jgi:hypothetical protein